MKAYVTLLSTNGYLDGVLALNQSLKNVGAKYPLIVCLNNQISRFARGVLAAAQLETIELPVQDYSEEAKKSIVSSGVYHWSNTAGKLQIFGLEQFEKIVFLDSDMIVIKNIDHLFDKPHLTAAKDSPILFKGDRSHENLNSGLLVIEPNKKIVNELFKIGESIKKPDQDIIRAYFPEWNTHPELILSQGYNLFAFYLDDYRRNGLKTYDIRVLHFIGREKPFGHYSGELYPSQKATVEYYRAALREAIDSLNFDGIELGTEKI